MINLASDLRADVGNDAFAGTVALALRVVATVIERGEDVFVPGAYEAADVLAKSQLSGPWIDPPVLLGWPPFFEPSEDEKKARVDRAMTASGGKPLITRRTAVHTVADLFPIEDANAEHEALEGVDQEATEQDAASTPDETDAPDATQSAATTEHAKDPTTALNGAQVSSLLEIVQQVATRMIPRDTGVRLITSSFPVSETQAEAVMGEVGRTFFAVAPAPGARPAPPPPAPSGDPEHPDDQGDDGDKSPPFAPK
jgi:hypothetical protein